MREQDRCKIIYATVTNLAARLCGEARSGQILVDGKVHTAVEMLTEFEPVGELELKGFHRPVAAFDVADEGVEIEPMSRRFGDVLACQSGRLLALVVGAEVLATVGAHAAFSWCPRRLKMRRRSSSVVPPHTP